MVQSGLWARNPILHALLFTQFQQNSFDMLMDMGTAFWCAPICDLVL